MQLRAVQRPRGVRPQRRTTAGIALALLAVGSARLRWAANAVLAAAIAKVFLVDAAGLEGLARSGSFLARGLCLAGLAGLNRGLGAGGGQADA